MPEDKAALAIGGLGLAGLLTYLVTRKVEEIGVRRRPPCGDYGDVDGDRWVTEKDAMLIAHYLIMKRQGIITLTDDQIRRADVRGTGKVTMEDAMFIRYYLAGYRDTFPVCGRI